MWLSYLCSTYISSGLQAQLHDLKNTTKRDVDVVWRYFSLRWKVLSCSTVKYKQEEISKQNRTVLYWNWVQDPYFNAIYLPTLFTVSTYMICYYQSWRFNKGIEWLIDWLIDWQLHTLKPKVNVNRSLSLASLCLMARCRHTFP